MAPVERERAGGVGPPRAVGPGPSSGAVALARFRPRASAVRAHSSALGRGPFARARRNLSPDERKPPRVTRGASNDANEGLRGLFRAPAAPERPRQAGIFHR